jgi:hypothetical protein
MNLTDIYRVLNTIATVYAFFLVAHETFFKIDHILDHKANLNKYKNNWNNPLYTNKGIKLEFNSKENHKNHSCSNLFWTQYTEKGIPGILLVSLSL